MLRMGIDEILASKRDEILRIAVKHGVSRIRVFGSVARGEAGPDSDVDRDRRRYTAMVPGRLDCRFGRAVGPSRRCRRASWLHEIIKEDVLAEAVAL